MQSTTKAGREVLTGEFDLLVKEMANWHGWSSSTVRRKVLTETRMLFRWLPERVRENMAAISLEDVRGFYMHRIQEVTSQTPTKHAMKLAFGYMLDTGRIGFDPSSVFALKVPRRKRLLPAMDTDKIAMILDAIDRNTKEGKRDYALLLLAVTTGLRRSDIAKLRRQDIDWREGVVNVMQRKTSQAYSLPLLHGVGEALKDYILNVRGDSKLENVFVSKRLGKPLHICTMVKIFAHYCRKVGIVRKPNDGLTFHSFRRAVGKRLCTAGVPLTTIAQYLGHSNLESTGHYLSLDVKSLAGCALGFDCIGEGGSLWK